MNKEDALTWVEILQTKRAQEAASAINRIKDLLASGDRFHVLIEKNDPHGISLMGDPARTEHTIEAGPPEEAPL